MENQNKDMCQRSLHVIQKRCVDLKLHVSSKNNEGNEKNDSKVKLIDYHAMFQKYLRKLILYSTKF